MRAKRTQIKQLKEILEIILDVNENQSRGTNQNLRNKLYNSKHTVENFNKNPDQAEGIHKLEGRSLKYCIQTKKMGRGRRGHCRPLEAIK